MRWADYITQEEFSDGAIAKSYSGWVGSEITGTPYPAHWNVLGLGCNVGNGKHGTQIISDMNREDMLFIRQSINQNGFAAWVKIATVQPPTEYNLPLVSGVQAAFDNTTCTYSRDQLSRVLVTATIAPSAGAWPSSTPINLAALPQGYRPALFVRIPAICLGTGGVFKTAFVTIFADGKIDAFASDTFTQICFQTSFVAQ